MKDILEELDGKAYTAGIYNDYDIRLCLEEEHEDLQAFLRAHWSPKHIFVLSKDILDFQHLNKETNTYNFVIAREKVSNEIHAILGFVPTSQFDEEIKRAMLWPCIWKSRKDINRTGLGVTMYHYLKSNFATETISILGISEHALSIYKHWNFKTGVIEHFVMPNFKAADHLARGLSTVYHCFDAERIDDKFLLEVSKSEYLEMDSENPIFRVNSIYKSKGYYLNRFMKHPIYKYVFLGIRNKDSIDAIIVARSCGDGEANCLRIVDFIGDVSNLIGVRNQLQAYLQRYDYEYVDLIEVGLEKSVLNAAGFINRKDYSGMIVPNYFEPFLRENIDLDYAYKTVVEDSKEIFFKADADQDRPNLL